MPEPSISAPSGPDGVFWTGVEGAMTAQLLEGKPVAEAVLRDVAARVGVSEQQVANVKFQAKKRLTEFLRAARLSPDVFPEIKAE